MTNHCACRWENDELAEMCAAHWAFARAHGPQVEPRTVTRYDLEQDAGCAGYRDASGYMDESEGGDWVRYDDIKHLLADEPEEPPTIDARIHQGNEVIVDVLDLTQFATVRVRGPLKSREEYGECSICRAGTVEHDKRVHAEGCPELNRL